MAEPFSFSEIQANHILDMTLARLTRLGRSNLEEEHAAALIQTIAELEAILGDPAKLRGVIARGARKDPRRSSQSPAGRWSTHDPGELGVEDLIEDEEIVVTMTRAGYIKAVSSDAFRTQGRGGRGVQGARLKEEDLISIAVHTTTLAHLLLFSNKGRVFRSARPRGSDEGAHRSWDAVVNLLPLAPDETIQALVATKDFESGGLSDVRDEVRAR